MANVKVQYCHCGWSATGVYFGGTCPCDFRVPTRNVLHVEIKRAAESLPDAPGVFLLHSAHPVAYTGQPHAHAGHYVGWASSIRAEINRLSEGSEPHDRERLSNVVNVWNKRMLWWEPVSIGVCPTVEAAEQAARLLHKRGQLARKCEICNPY